MVRSFRFVADTYIDDRKHELKDRVVEDYKRTLNRLTAYCSSKNVFHMHDLSADLLLQVSRQRVVPAMEDVSKKAVVDKLRQFLRILLMNAVGHRSLCF